MGQISNFSFSSNRELLRNIQLEASAGTGKTYTIERIVALLIAVEAIPVSRILIVTFTRKAARELKDRVRNILTGAMRQGQIDLGGEIRSLTEEELENIHKSLQEFEKASILTIHSFCLNMLKAYPFESLSQFSMDMESRDDLTGEAVRDYLREIGESMERGQLLQYKAFLGNGGYELAVEKLASAVNNELFEPDLEVIPDDETRREIIETAMDFNNGRGLLHDAWLAMMKILPDADRLGDLGFGHLNWFTPGLDKLRNLRSEGDLLSLSEAIAEGEILKTLERFLPDNLEKTLKKGADGAVVSSDPFVRAAEDFLNLYCYDQDNLKSNLYLRSLRTSFLIEGYGRIGKTLHRKKDITGKLDFNDLIGKLHEALCGENKSIRPEFLSEIRKRYRTVLIDEFQDTDSRQWDIFHSLFGSDDSHNLFLVGDPKQSIYRFRGADLEIYHRACESDCLDGRYTLGKNFRSVTSLVEGVNGIFARVFAPEMHCGSTGMTPFQPVEAGRPDEPKLKDGGNAVEFLLIENAADEKTGIAGISTARSQFYQIIAFKTYSLLSGGVLLGDRPVHPGDIAILTENNRECQMLQNLLSLYAIPSVINARERIFDTEEAGEFLLFLQSMVRLDGPSARLLLLSRFFACSPAQIEAMESSGELDSLSSLLLQWREMSDRGKLIEASRQLIDLSGFEKHVLAEKNGERSYSNMHQILEYLHGEQQRGRLNTEELYALLLGRIGGKSPADEDLIRLDKDSEAVQIMTMHASKGLEFPVVFFAGAIRKDPPSGRVDYFDFVKGKKRYYDFFKSESHRTLASMDQWEERKRLYYVALTRASSKLYLPFIPRLELCYLSSLYSSFCPDELETLARSDESFEPFSHPVHSGMKLKKSLKDRNRPRSALYDVLDKAVLDLIGDGETYYSLNRELEGEFDSALRRGEPLIYGEGTAEGRLFLPELENSENFNDRYDRISSYSSLIRHLDERPATATPFQQVADHDDVVVIERASSTEEELTRGAVFGELIHKLFEELDFSIVEKLDFNEFSGNEVVEELFKSLSVRFFNSQWYGRFALKLKNLVYNTLKTPLDGEFSLSRLENNDRVHEMEFHVAVNDCESLTLGEDFKGSLEKGFLKGFIDLIFKRDGKYYIADWKTTSSPEGNGPEAYGKEILDEMMKVHHYNLQAAIYTTALTRYLESTEGGNFDYERDYGGCYYFFVRGMKGEEDFGSGVHFSRMSAEDLSRFATQITIDGEVNL